VLEGGPPVNVGGLEAYGVNGPELPLERIETGLETKDMPRMGVGAPDIHLPQPWLPPQGSTLQR